MSDIFSPQLKTKIVRLSLKNWSYVNSLRNGQNNMPSLRENGILRTDSKNKASIPKIQFHSVFTEEDFVNLPQLGKGHYPTMNDIYVNTNGVGCYFGKLDKASGPDTFNARIL